MTYAIAFDIDLELLQQSYPAPSGHGEIKVVFASIFARAKLPRLLTYCR